MQQNKEIQKLLTKESYSFEDLAAIMRILRSEEGCPWDREQDHHSIRTCLIEETYEVAEAIDNEDSVLGILYNNTPYYFQKNLQGDVIAILNRNAQELYSLVKSKV